MSPTATNRLSGIVKISAVALVVTLGIWGCARKPAEAGPDRVRTLEARCVKLDQDYRTVVQARDKALEEADRLKADASEHEALVKERDELRREAAAIQADRERLAKQVQDRTAERDQITRDLNVRTAERDTALTRYEKLRKTLQTLVSQEDGGPQQQQGTDAPITNGPMIGGNS